MKNTTKLNLDDKFLYHLILEEIEKLTTEYYDLVYEYKNDCLTTGIKYKRLIMKIEM